MKKPLVLSTYHAGAPDSGPLTCSVACYHDAEGRLWAGTPSCTPAPVVEVISLPHFNLVAVTAADDEPEIFIATADEWAVAKREARPLPPLESFGDHEAREFGRMLAAMAPEERAAFEAQILAGVRSAVTPVAAQPAVTVERGRIADHLDHAGGYDVVDVSCDGLTVSWDPAEPSRILVLSEASVELSPAKARALRTLLNNPAVLERLGEA